MQGPENSQFFSDPELQNESASIGEQSSSGCLLRFDILSAIDFVAGEDSASLDVNILLRAGIKYKRYERIHVAAPEIAVIIETNRFKYTLTRNQISAKLYYLNACEEFISVYKCLISSLLPPSFKSHLKVFNQSKPHCESTVKADQLILQHLQEGRVQECIEHCNTSPTKSISSESNRVSQEAYLPRITASITMAMESFKESIEASRFSVESSSPRELVTPFFNGSPRSISSPRIADAALSLTPSPRDDSSPRDTSSPRHNSGTRLLCFFKRMGSEHFAIKKSPSRSPRQRVSNAEISSTHSENITAQSPVKSSSVPESLSPKEKSVSIKIQKANSFVSSSGERVSTEIQYSPRGRSVSEAGSSSRNRAFSPDSLESDSVADILLYCGSEVITWCDSLNLNYRKIKHEFFITLPNKDVIRIQGHRIHANSLDSNTVNFLIDLVKVLPYVENVSIYYVSQGTLIDECIVSRLSTSPTEPEVSQNNLQ